ncbi:4'-phosphopantetheinyl transferase family protein [Diaminobutyricibacter sp. McL0608]|uniref:4'-phosphopantetheinyl transferase family protein n=1 Tax=Leifsonia sp. McL0608 TaxID=3143537 RepID=UPI0031F2E6AE
MRWAPVERDDAHPDADGAHADADASHLLTAAEFARYGSLRPEPARTFLAGRRLLRELVASVAGADPDEVVIEARCPFCGGAHGRPAVLAPPAATNLRLGLAHSDGLVVAAAAWAPAVGIDVERSDAAHTPERDRAIASVAGASGGDPLQHWTRVEAVLKADGRGLRVDPRSVRVTDDGDDVRATIDGSDTRYTLEPLDLGPGHTASIAVRT